MVSLLSSQISVILLSIWIRVLYFHTSSEIYFASCTANTVLFYILPKSFQGQVIIEIILPIFRLKVYLIVSLVISHHDITISTLFALLNMKCFQYRFTVLKNVLPVLLECESVCSALFLDLVRCCINETGQLH